MSIEYIDYASYLKNGAGDCLNPAADNASVRLLVQKHVVSVSEWFEFLDQSEYRWPCREDLRKVSPTPHHPAVFVSWFDACVFCEWQSFEVKKHVRLPKATEWERVCRAVMSGAGPSVRNPVRDFEEWAERYEEVNAVVEDSMFHNSQFPVEGIWWGVSEWCVEWYDDDLPGISMRPGAWKVWCGGSPLNDGYPQCDYRGYDDPNFRGPRLGFRTVIGES